MEKLKDPAMLLSVANSIGLVGTTAYFYKQIESIRLDMVKMGQTLTGVIRKLGEMEKGEQHKSEALHTLNDQLKRINEQIDDLPSFDNIDHLDLDLTEIIAVLEEHNISIERPSQQRSRRSGDRRAPGPSYISNRRDSDVDDRREPTRRFTPRNRSETSRDQDGRSCRPSSRDSTRDSTRELRAPSREPRPEPRPDTIPASSYEDDDADLIGEVRRQQGRN